MAASSLPGHRIAFTLWITPRDLDTADWSAPAAGPPYTWMVAPPTAGLRYNILAKGRDSDPDRIVVVTVPCGQLASWPVLLVSIAEGHVWQELSRAPFDAPTACPKITESDTSQTGELDSKGLWHETYRVKAAGASGPITWTLRAFRRGTAPDPGAILGHATSASGSFTFAHAFTCQQLKTYGVLQLVVRDRTGELGWVNAGLPSWDGGQLDWFAQVCP